MGSVRRTRGRECVLQGFSWLTVPPGTQKKPVLASPAVEHLPPPRAGASHAGENPEDPAAGLCWPLHYWAANGFQGKKENCLEKVHELGLNQGLHLAYSLQLPTYVVNSILGRKHIYFDIYCIHVFLCATHPEKGLQVVWEQARTDVAWSLSAGRTGLPTGVAQFLLWKITIAEAVPMSESSLSHEEGVAGGKRSYKAATGQGQSLEGKRERQVSHQVGFLNLSQIKAAGQIVVMILISTTAVLSFSGSQLVPNIGLSISHS